MTEISNRIVRYYILASAKIHGNSVVRVIDEILIFTCGIAGQREDSVVVVLVVVLETIP